MKIYFLGAILFSLNSYALIGGSNVSETDPLSKSVIALQMVEKLENGQMNLYKGSGVLVRQDMILTAGHNFFYLTDPSLSEAIFSAQSLWGSDALGQSRISVQKVIVYPGFSQSNLGTLNDLALVLLKNPAPKNYIPLKIELDGSQPPTVPEEAVLLGYGRSSEGTSALNSDYRLRTLNLKFARWDSSSIFNSQKLWFSNQHGSIAGGDSGGPCLLKEKAGSYKVYGVGIHERYDTCVKTETCESESAYSNTTFFADWIIKSLQPTR